MRKEEFIFWLASVKGYPENTISRRVNNCERIETFEGDLDAQFMQDNLANLLGRLAYSSEDQRQNKPLRHAIPINGDWYNGTATLRSAARLYQAFAGGSPAPLNKPLPKPRSKAKIYGNWPKWPIPAPEDILSVTKMATPYVRFLHPDLVAKIVSDNECNRAQWRKKMVSRGIDPEFYLWERSSCVFPGIRRYTGSKEIAFYRKQINEEAVEITEAFRLDDNSFPKHIWSFIFRGKAFQNFGPDGYSLAHLADHKDYKNRRENEFEIMPTAPEKLHGLYSCASNTVYMPTSFIRLTDFNMDTRLLMLHKAQSLYGDFCNLLPPSFKLNPPASPEWNVDNFIWADPVGADADLDGFLSFRANTINSL